MRRRYSMPTGRPCQGTTVVSRVLCGRIRAEFSQNVRNRNMRKRSFRVFLSSVALLSIAAAGWADSATVESNPQPDVLQPYIVVEADYFEVDLLEERAYFSGDVAAQQGGNTFRTANLTLHLEQIIGGGEPQADKRSPAAGGQHPYELSAAILSYDLSRDLIIGSGGSELRRGAELILADRIEYQVLARKAFGIPDAGGRVTVQFIANPDMPVFPFAAPAAAE